MDHSQRRRRRARSSRVMRVRQHIHGTAERPRLSVFKSNLHLYAQLIDDDKGVTIAGVGTMSKKNQSKKSKASARKIGEEIAEIAKLKKITTAIFDRGRYKFHGIIAELANAAREKGLQF